MKKRIILFLCLFCLLCACVLFKHTQDAASDTADSSILMSVVSGEQYDNLLELTFDFEKDDGGIFEEEYIPKGVILKTNDKQIDCLSINYRSERLQEKDVMRVYMICSLRDNQSFEEISINVLGLINCSEYKKYSIKEYYKNWEDTVYIEKKDTDQEEFELTSTDNEVEIGGKKIKVGNAQCSKNLVMIDCQEVIAEKNNIAEYTNSISNDSGIKAGIYVTVVYADSEEVLECSLDDGNNIIALSPNGLERDEIHEIRVGKLIFIKNRNSN